MSNSVCFVYSERDVQIAERLYARNKEVKIVSNTITGIASLQSSNLPFTRYDVDCSVATEKNVLHDMARKIACNWYKDGNIGDIKELSTIQYYKGVSIFDIHYTYFFFSVFEILQSICCVEKVLSSENVTKVYIPRSQSELFGLNRLDMMNSSVGGLERDVLLAYCKQKKISYQIIDGENFIVKKAKHLVLLLFRFKSGLRKKQHSNSPILRAASEEDKNVLKIMLFIWGGYYFDQIYDDICKLLEEGYALVIVINGGDMPATKKRFLQTKKVTILYKEDLSSKKANGAYKLWKRDGKRAFQKIKSNKNFIKHFEFGEFEFFKDIFVKHLDVIFTRRFPTTVYNAELSHTLMTEFKPDMVFTQFALHGEEISDVIPAGINNIPILTATHGVVLSNSIIRDYFYAHYYATIGEVHSETMQQYLDIDEKRLLIAGNERFKNVKILNEEEKTRLRKKYGFDPNLPLCIYCDNTILSQNWTEHRHSTLYTLEKILGLKALFPGMQIIIRFHHGIDLSFIHDYITKLNVTGVVIQDTLGIPFLEIVQAADYVIAHQSSAIVEALISGIRVLYLKAMSYNEKSYDEVDKEILIPLNSFEELEESAKRMHLNEMSPDEVVRRVQPFINKIVYQGENSLSDLIIGILKTKDKLDFGIGYGKQILASLKVVTGAH